MFIIHSKLIKKVAILLGVLLILGLILHWFIVQKVESTLKTALPDEITLNYEDIEVSTLGRSLSLDNVSITLKDSTNDQELANFTIERLDFKNFGIIDYLNNKTIALNYVGISNANGYIKLPDHLAKDNNDMVKPSLFDKVSIGEIELANITMQLNDQETDSVTALMTDLNLKVNEVQANAKDDTINWSYNSYTIATDSIVLTLGPFNTLSIKSVIGTQDSTIIASAELKTKFEPGDLRNHIRHEMDYYDLKIEDIAIHDIPKTLSGEKSPLNLGKVIVNNPNAFIYRDKLLADDIKVKPMLSEIIRNIPFDFTIPSFEINNATLTYKERVHAYNDGGALSFENSFISIPNLSNTADYQPVSIDIKAKLIGSGEVKASWQFNVLNQNDDFTFSADVSHINLESINSFSQPNFNTEMEGRIDKLYYNISGNKRTSHIDIKAKYSDIKISILDKTHKSRNKFFSSVANIIVHKNSKNKKSDFKEAKANVERDITKSNINYIFHNVKTGLTKIFI
jgi:hypothetical protein